LKILIAFAKQLKAPDEKLNIFKDLDDK